MINSAMIDKNTIEKIFHASNIVEVISDFVTLKKAGQNYRGLSPFKNEKTPSFFVSPVKGIFKCFSTGIGGNVVSFLIEHEKITYPEALRYLARKYNIEIIEKEETPEEKKQKDERESLLSLNQYACRYFMDTLHTSEGKAIGISYLYERGLRDEAISKFQIGYAREERTAFTRTALENGFKLEYLVNSGLTIAHESNPYDRFHGRILFPIHGLTGQVLGFGGRIMKKTDKAAKYINSTESEVYHKSDILYGLYFARQSIARDDKCYLVEGYTDVISMHQAGIENVVASSGTSLTANQIRLIKRFTHNITILYDGDEAGIKASLRGIDLLLEEGLHVRVVLLPDGEDPDSFARKMNAAAFSAFILAHETDFLTYKSSLYKKEAESDPIRKAELITEIVRSISVIPESIVRSVYLRECGKILDVDEQVLYREISRLRRMRNEQQVLSERPKTQSPFQLSQSVQQIQPSHEKYGAEKEVIRLLITYGNHLFTLPGSESIAVEKTCAGYLLSEIEADEIEFHHPIYSRILEEVKQLYHSGKQILEEVFIRHPDETVSRTITDLIATAYDLSRIWKRHESFFETEDMRLREILPAAILALKNEKVLRLIRESETELAFAQEQGLEDKINLLQNKIMVLNNLKINLAKGLGDRIIISHS